MLRGVLVVLLHEWPGALVTKVGSCLLPGAEEMDGATRALVQSWVGTSLAEDNYFLFLRLARGGHYVPRGGSPWGAG